MRPSLSARADVDSLATAQMTTLQGGLLLAQTLRATEPLQNTLSTVIDHIEPFATRLTRMVEAEVGATISLDPPTDLVALECRNEESTL